MASAPKSCERFSDFVVGSIFPLSALRSKLSFERRERELFRHTQVPRNPLPMEFSALNGAGSKEMAQLYHDAEIQPSRSTPCRHSMEQNPAPQGKVRSTARKILLRDTFRHQGPSGVHAGRPPVQSFIPWSSIRRHSSQCFPGKDYKPRTMEQELGSYVLLHSGHGRKRLIPERKGERRCIGYLALSAGRALHSLLAVAVQCCGHEIFETE